MQNNLERSVFLRQGTLPVVLTVPHDGIYTKLGSLPLEHNPSGKPRDVATRILARDIYAHILNKAGQVPSLVVEMVHRRHQTPEIMTYLTNTVLGLVRGEFYSEMENLLVLDIHGFTKQPSLGDCDLVLGTGHKRTVRSSSVDEHFAAFMAARGYEVYLPTRDVVPGEKYAADTSQTLVQQMYRMAPENVVGVQVEIAKRFREKGAVEKGRKLSSDMGDFILDYCQ